MLKQFTLQFYTRQSYIAVLYKAMSIAVLYKAIFTVWTRKSWPNSRIKHAIWRCSCQQTTPLQSSLPQNKQYSIDNNGTHVSRVSDVTKKKNYVILHKSNEHNLSLLYELLWIYMCSWLRMTFHSLKKSLYQIMIHN